MFPVIIRNLVVLGLLFWTLYYLMKKLVTIDDTEDVQEKVRRAKALLKTLQETTPLKHSEVKKISKKITELKKFLKEAENVRTGI